MKKIYVVFLIAIILALVCQPLVAAENSASTAQTVENPAAATPSAENKAITATAARNPTAAAQAADPDYITLVHSDKPYTIAQASSPDNNYPYTVEKKDDVLNIIDKASGIRAAIIYESLDNAAFDALRDYYNDSSLTDDELFNRYTELVKSYITASESMYNANSINGGEMAAETAMRVFYEGREKLYGLDGCSIYLYNIVRYEGLNYTEQAYLDVIVPDRDGNTVIMIKFTIPADKIDMAASGTVASLLSGIRFNGLPPQYSAPAVLKDSSVINASKLGIYPAASQEQPNYELYSNTDAGFSVSLPTTYVPFLQNNLGGIYSYTSFKINPNEILSITSEPLPVSGNPNSYNYFMVASLGTINLIDSGAFRYGNNLYSHFAYSSSETSKSKAKQFFYDYYIENEDGSKLYKLQLQSSIAGPGANVRRQLEEILASFSTKKASSAQSVTSPSINAVITKPMVGTVSQSTPSAIEATTKYMNSDEGYSFTYPKSWQLEDVSSDIAYDRLRLIDPGLSGSLEILVQESELKESATFIDIIKSVDGLSASNWSALTTGYEPPYAGRTSKLLFSNFSIDGSIFTINRLIAFTDNSGRNRLCCSTDILKGHKLYSMFIIAGEYMIKDGRFSDIRINGWVSELVASFRIETTKESEARRISGESRNRKIVFVENYLKQAFNSNITISSVGKIQPDNTLFVAVSSTTEGGVEYVNESGFYKVKLDYLNRKVELVNRILNRDIIRKELDILIKRYQDKIIMNVYINEPDMTITVKSLENESSTPVTNVYHVNTSLTGNNVEWKTVQLTP